MKESQSSQEKLLQIYRSMVTIRQFEEEIARRWPEQEMRSPPHFCTGEEGIAAGVCAALDSTDEVMGYYRGHGYYLAKGGDPYAFMAEMYCKKTGSNEGKAGSMLLSDPKVGYIGASAIVGGGIPIATGVSFAHKLRETGKVVVCFFGDAATEEGVFPESLNFASLQKLPIIYVCVNDSYAVTTHIAQRRAVPEKIITLADPYNIPATKIDGNNPQLVYQTAAEAIARARLGSGPSFIEAVTFRWNEHVGEKRDDYSGRRTPEELAYWMSKDPILLLEKDLLKMELLTDEAIEIIRRETAQLIQKSFDFAISSALPTKEDLLTNVYPKIWQTEK